MDVSLAGHQHARLCSNGAHVPFSVILLPFQFTTLGPGSAPAPTICLRMEKKQVGSFPFSLNSMGISSAPTMSWPPL